jgi:nitrite reductase/ring-hydroxylating ferredoxin subunit
MGEDRDILPPGGCLRRRVLLTSLTGALTAGLVGCTSSKPSAPDADTGTAVVADPQVLARTGDVPVGGGVTVGNILLVQPTAGTFRAFSIICPHRGARVSPPDNRVITCWEHNSTFTVEDGSRIGGPATRGLTQMPITVNGTDIITARPGRS